MGSSKPVHHLITDAEAGFALAGAAEASKSFCYDCRQRPGSAPCACHLGYDAASQVAPAMRATWPTAVACCFGGFQYSLTDHLPTSAKESPFGLGKCN